MSHAVRRRLSDRARRGRPQIAIGVVSQEDAIARWISHRVVVPRSDAIKEAVACPGRAASTFAHHESAGGIAYDVDPRGGRKIAARQVNLVFAIRVESAQAVEE